MQENKIEKTIVEKIEDTVDKKLEGVGLTQTGIERPTQMETPLPAAPTYTPESPQLVYAIPPDGVNPAIKSSTQTNFPPPSPLDTEHARAAQTTEEEQRKFQGQRLTNNIWEGTQAVVAIIVTIAQIYCAITGIESQALNNAFTLIIAIYFVRMNHIKIGGIGGTDSR